MTHLNTIIEEEVETYKNDYAQAITDVGGFGLAKHIERFLTTAMQRAYKAGREKRDTYWKERVGEIRLLIAKYAKAEDMDVAGLVNEINTLCK